MREKANASSAFSLERERDVFTIIGQKGVVARSIEEDYKCRVDVDKKTLMVTVKGESENQRNAAVNKMKELIAKDREEATTRSALAKEQKANGGCNKVDISVTAEPQLFSKTKNGDLNAQNGEENDKMNTCNQFPNQPVGVAKSSKNGHGKKKKKKKVDASIDEGTEAGKNLFAMLMSQD